MTFVDDVSDDDVILDRVADWTAGRRRDVSMCDFHRVAREGAPARCSAGR